MTPQLRALVEAEALKTVSKDNPECDSAEHWFHSQVTMFKKGAQFLFDHLSKPSEDDEKAAIEYAHVPGFNSLNCMSPEAPYTDQIKYESYLAACTQKNAVIAALEEKLKSTRESHINLYDLNEEKVMNDTKKSSDT